mgnify:CR=1 FL=1
MSIQSNVKHFQSLFEPLGCKLIAVSKTHPAESVMEAYRAGQRLFGENKVQEMVAKYELLPKDIEWHLIGHLQRNKVKYVAPWVALIHAVDSLALLQEIDKQGCADSFLPMLLIENSGMQRQTSAAVESLRNESVKGMNLTVKAIVAAATGQIQQPRIEAQKGEDNARISHQE